MTETSAAEPGDALLAGAPDRFNPDELLQRYARGRVRHFGQRQLLTGLGGITLWIVDGPLIGLLAIALALLGEAVDCLYLRGVTDRLNRGVTVERVRRISTLTGLFQALTIAGCVSLAWFGHAGALSIVYPAAFLAGAAINAGVVLPYHRSAGIARLAVYGLTVVMFIADYLARVNDAPGVQAMNVAGLLILMYLVVTFVGYALGVFDRQKHNILALADQARMLESANEDLMRRDAETRRLATALDHANDSVLVCGPDGRITWVNDGFTRTNGFTFDEAVGKLPGEFLNAPETDPATVAEISAALQDGRPFRGEILNKTKTGERIWIETNLVPVKRADGDGPPDMFVAVERDITRAKEQERELALARDAAEDGARAKSEFLATMSHEIRTPMNGVIGMADLLCDTPLDDEQRHYADTIKASSQALLKIINDVLDLSKLDAGKVELSPEPFDLRHCLEGVVRLMRPEAEKKGLTLTTDIAADLPDLVIGDDGRIRQVLVNLLGNALKFTDTGGASVSARAVPDEDSWGVVIEVSDTGVGIPAAKLDTIFDSFAQADATTTRRYGGTGLGLAISRRLVETMSGTLTVTSREGAGACFRVSVPLSRVPADMQAAPPAAALTDEDIAQLAGLDILVAEDSSVNRFLIGKFLGDLGLTLRFAHDGGQAVTMSDSQTPDIILMDMSMPVLSGIEATRQIRARPGPQPVIVALTANAFADDRAACIEAGMEAFLTKPVSREELLDCLLRSRPQVAAASEA